MIKLSEMNFSPYTEKKNYKKNRKKKKQLNCSSQNLTEHSKDLQSKTNFIEGENKNHFIKKKIEEDQKT